jgi:cysteine desulfurase
VEGVLNTISHTELNGHPTLRLPHNANLSFDFIEGEALHLYLNMNGIACSSGSACSSGIQAPSHVLTALGLTGHMLASGSRFTIGMGVDEEQIDYTLEILRDKVALLRSMSPFFHE